MNKLDFYIVDVFAERKYAGNQLAVFRNSESLTDNQMQAIAREMNFSETTFIASDEMQDGGFDVRIFTPAAEVPFAGHPTLGTAFIIRGYILKNNVQRITLNLEVGQIPVTLTYAEQTVSDLWMKQINPTFGRQLSSEEVTPILNVDKDDIDSRYPIQEVSTGLPFFIVPLKTLGAVRKIKINRQRYDDCVARIKSNAISGTGEGVVPSGFFVFCPQTYDRENHLNARMFDDYYGVPEDPATGSANGCFLAYLLKHRYFDKTELDLRVEQGYEINRPSLIKIKGKVVNDREIDVNVGGKVQMIAKGEWV